MAFLILPIASLILYILGLFFPDFVLFMAAIGFAVAVFSFSRCKKYSKKDLYNTIGTYFSVAMVIIGAVYLVVIFLSQFILGPVLSSVI